ncbi:MAG: AAA-like domain-containing protein [Cyanobacteriota bacterium]|nr:AAA-like domain-containing protein [Cyanobacteriota bacterium]
MSWMNFLRKMADKYELSPPQTQIFLPRFNEDNQNRSEKEIKEDLKKYLKIEIDVESYKKRMGSIYAKFTKNRQNPEGCPDLNYNGPHKFYKLLYWLEKKYGKPEQIKYPDGYVPLDSPFYVERNPVESLCYETVREPGSLIRIKAPHFMGKTSLMRRILTWREKEEYKNVYLDLASVENSVITDLEKLERWLCTKVGQELNLKNKLKDYWDGELMTVNENCTSYFRDYILTKIKCPLVLGLDEIDRLFSYPEVAGDFFAMLRNWHEEGKISETWQQLRITLAYATDIYIPLDLNQSPFNVGFPAELPEFSQEQVENLAKVHKLNLNQKEIVDFMAMVGGHPYLVRLGLYHLATGEITMKELLINAPTEAGIYSDRLRIMLATMETSPELLQAFKSVVTSSDGVVLKPNFNRKLHAMGLVKQKGNYVTPSCNLYAKYFQVVFSLK